MNVVNRRDFLKASAAVLGAVAAPRVLGAEQSRRRPNVLYVFSDMQRAYSMGCYGDANARTPILDAFAKQGARLDAAISNTPVCCPYRACLMSGQYAHRHNVMANGSEFRPTVPTIAQTFRAAGYETGYAGKWHIFPPKDAKDPTYGFPPAKTEYGVYIKDRQPEHTTEVALKFIAEKSEGQAPWLFFVSWIPPHQPYEAPPGYAEHFPHVAIPPNVPAGAATDYARKNLPDYYGMIESLDVEFGRILQALDKAGVAEDTIVVFSSDHGDMIGSHGLEAKRWPYEESARIPFLIRYPRAIKPGAVIADPVSSVDFYPTLAGLAGLKAPAGVDGADFSPLFRGETAKPPRNYVYLAMPYSYVVWPGWRALRTREYMYARVKDKPWLLFDVANDPWEMRNLVEDPAKKQLVRELDDRLSDAMRKTGDSWDVKTITSEDANSDQSEWEPGGRQAWAQELGGDFPGKVAAPPQGAGEEKNKKEGKPEKRKKQKKTGAGASAAEDE